MSGKLYHRIKKDGKWTWTPCEAFTRKWKQCVKLHPDNAMIILKEEEE